MFHSWKVQLTNAVVNLQLNRRPGVSLLCQNTLTLGPDLQQCPHSVSTLKKDLSPLGSHTNAANSSIEQIYTHTLFQHHILFLPVFSFPVSSIQRGLNSLPHLISPPLSPSPPHV